MDHCVSYIVNIDNSLFVKSIQDTFIDYKKIIKNKFTILTHNEDISIIINSLHSLKVLEKCIAFIKFSLEKANKNASITVVQNGEMPTHRDFCQKNNLNYVFIPYKKDEFSKHNDALCYNVGVLANQKSNHFIVLRSDVLIPHDFFTNFNINEQCFFVNYSHNTLNYVGRPDVELLINRPGLYNLYQLHYVKGHFNDCNKCITFSKELFNEVGGFDVELKLIDENIIFKLFKNKVSFLKKISNKTNHGLSIFILTPLRCSAYTIEDEILFLFDKLTQNEKNIYLAERKKLYNSVVEKLKDSNKINK